MSKYFHKLFEPLNIGSITVKNRISQCAMDPGPFVANGVFQQKNANILIRRAKGGVGLIVTGCNLVENGDGSMFADNADVFIPGAKKMMDEIHSYGGKCFIQLSAGVGRNLQMTEESAPGLPEIFKVAPSDGTPNVYAPNVKHKGMSKEHIRKMIKGFGDASEAAKAVGIDGIEVHALHEGYLLDQFSIASINRRTDEYGGSMENRLRFVREILEEIKQRCGKDYPVIIRFSVESKMKGFNSGRLPMEKDTEEFGRSRSEAGEMAKALEDMGYDALNTDNGSYDAWYWAHPPVYMPKLCNLEDAVYVKQFVNIPVICAGRMDDPERAGKAIAEGGIDGIALGRALLADPDWPNKVERGKFEDVRPCIACQAGCLRTFLGDAMTCVINPRLGDGNETDYLADEISKNIAVVGGGIGGMETARILALRGHKITLFEKTNNLGGVFIAAAAPDFKEADKALIKWYENQMQHPNITLKMGCAASADELEKGYDLVVLATGSSAKIPPIEGICSENVISAVQALLDKNSVIGPVVVMGGGLTGCEIAYQCAKDGFEVTVVEIMPDILGVKGLCRANSLMLRDLLKYYGVRVLTDTKVNLIENGSVTVETNGIEEKLPCSTLVVSTGYASDDALYEELKTRGVNCVNIGDSKKVGNLLSVVRDAHDAAARI